MSSAISGAQTKDQLLNNLTLFTFKEVEKGKGKEKATEKDKKSKKSKTPRITPESTPESTPEPTLEPNDDTDDSEDSEAHPARQTRQTHRCVSSRIKGRKGSTLGRVGVIIDPRSTAFPQLIRPALS